MHIKVKDFRVREGDEVDLRKWPTLTDPVYASKRHYQELLAGHVAKLSEQQQLLYASELVCRSGDFSGDGCGRQGWRNPARDVGGQSARLPGI